MKRIEFIAPVEAVRGNLSGTQDLRYALNDNKAYEAPAGQRNYARNYRPSFIGAKRASDGHKYFSVRTKSCVHKTAKWTKQAALLGGAGAIFADIVRVKTSALYAQLYAQWLELQALGSKFTFREAIMNVLITMLRAKAETGVYAGPRGPIFIDNPWVKIAETLNVRVSDEVLVKFWKELATNPITFSIEGVVGVAHANNTFAVVAQNNFNVLNLVIDDEDGNKILAAGVNIYSPGSSVAIVDTDLIQRDVDYTITPAE